MRGDNHRGWKLGADNAPLDTKSPAYDAETIVELPIFRQGFLGSSLRPHSHPVTFTRRYSGTLVRAAGLADRYEFSYAYSSPAGETISRQRQGPLQEVTLCAGFRHGFGLIRSEMTSITDVVIQSLITPIGSDDRLSTGGSNDACFLGTSPREPQISVGRPIRFRDNRVMFKQPRAGVAYA